MSISCCSVALQHHPSMAQQPSVPHLAPRAMREQRKPLVSNHRRILRASNIHQSTSTQASYLSPLLETAMPFSHSLALGFNHEYCITSQSPSPAVAGNARNIPSMNVTGQRAMSLSKDAIFAGRDDSRSLPGSSTVWLSKEERLREAFTSSCKSAIRLGFHNSPFFPQSVAEYAEARAQAIKKCTKSLTNKIIENQNAADQHKEAQAARERREHLAAHPMLLEDPRLFNRLLALPVLQQPSKSKNGFYNMYSVGQVWTSTIVATDEWEYKCFTNTSSGDATPQKDNWPSLASFKMCRGTGTFPPPSRPQEQTGHSRRHYACPELSRVTDSSEHAE